MSEIFSFLIFLGSYWKSRVRKASNFIEKVKDFVVALLIVRRGKYSIAFLNTLFFVFSMAFYVLAPLISENNPFVKNENFSSSQVIALDYDPWRGSFQTEFSVKPRDRIIEYTVKSGDTLGKIAEKFGVSINTIKWANNLKSETVKIGQKLKIPPISGVVHKVKSGETIYSIAKKYKVHPQNIVNFPFNEFLDYDTFALRVGQILYVPGGVIEEPKRVVRRSVKRNNYPLNRLPGRYLVAGKKGTGRFITPTTGIITQGYLWYHRAVDIANPSAPPIIAADAGVITYAGCLRYGYGCHIVVDHGNGFKTLYAHLSKIYVSVGQRVKQGEVIGRMGTTGRSTGIHLHFEIRKGGRKLNPLSFLR